MLVDYISPERLPTVSLWLDWCLYAYRYELVACLIASTFHWLGSELTYSFGMFTVSVLFGFCLWVLVCMLRQGYGLG